MIDERVRQRREALHLTQDVLCDRLAVLTEGAWNPVRQDIFKIEDGRRSVHDTELLALGQALEVDSGWLLMGPRPLTDGSERTE